MKIQLWMRGRDSTGKVKVYRTITEQELAEIVGLLMANDGLRPWERQSDE